MVSSNRKDQVFYLAYGQVASVIEPTGAVTTYGYDNMGRMTRVVNALGGTVSYTYNPRGQKLSESGNATYPVENEYDDDTGLLSAHCLHRNSNTDDRTYYYYDSCTQLLKEKCDANGSSVRYEYDSNGLLSKRTWARTTSNGADLITSYTYNVFGELASVSYNDATPNVSFTRDALGREIGRSDGAGSHTTVYNAYGEVTSEQHSIPNATVSYSYDSLGRQAEITASSGGSTFYQTSQSYNPATGQVISATFASSATFTFGYVPGTNLESSIVTSAFTKTVTYEANRDLPSEIKYLNSGTSLFSPKFNYTYDLLGRATTRVRDYETNTFAYNPRSEVTSAYVSNTLRTYQYDDAGNRTLADGIFQHETNALNQYTSVGSNYSPTYDADGNQTSYWPALVSVTDYAPRSIEYDAENRAVLFRDSNNSPLISCQYDAYGRRFRKNTYSGNTIVKQTCFLYAGTNLIAEFDQTDPCFPNFVLNNIFFWDPTQPIATRTLATIIYYHEEDSFSQSLYYYTHDLTKNVWNITNADGYSGDSFHYDAFGTLLQDHGADRLHFLFSNEYYDTETGLYYYLFRYYNPFDGRWLSKDPIGEEGGLNLYAFCGNNAVNMWDRSGMTWFDFDNIKDFFRELHLSAFNGPGPGFGYFGGGAYAPDPIRTLKYQFSVWYKKEYDKIYNNDKTVKSNAWIRDLNPCPEHIETETTEKYYISSPPGPAIHKIEKEVVDGKEYWTLTPDSTFRLFAKNPYHPDGEYELRSANPTQDDHGNQCIYDCNGDLITNRYDSFGNIIGKPSAGSADYVSPGNSISLGHLSNDVSPFNIILELEKYGEDVSSLYTAYYKVRPAYYYQNGEKFMNGEKVNW